MAAIPGDQTIAEFVVAGRPISAQTANRTLKARWQTEVATAAHTAYGSSPPNAGPLGVVITYYEPGNWHLDLDNMAKPILDAMTGIVWEDDKQLTDLYSARRSLDGAYVIRGMSAVLATAFVKGDPFIHIRVVPTPDAGVLL